MYGIIFYLARIRFFPGAAVAGVENWEVVAVSASPYPFFSSISQAAGAGGLYPSNEYGLTVL
jgi:hypothetical protein